MRHPTPQTPAELLLINCHLIDGLSDDPFPNHFVEIRDGKIVATGPMEKASQVKGLHVIDCQGRTVMPGLIDCHGRPPRLRRLEEHGGRDPVPGGDRGDPRRHACARRPQFGLHRGARSGHDRQHQRGAARCDPEQKDLRAEDRRQRPRHRHDRQRQRPAAGSLGKHRRTAGGRWRRRDTQSRAPADPRRGRQHQVHRQWCRGPPDRLHLDDDDFRGRTAGRHRGSAPVGPVGCGSRPSPTNRSSSRCAGERTRSSTVPGSTKSRSNSSRSRRPTSCRRSARSTACCSWARNWGSGRSSGRRWRSMNRSGPGASRTPTMPACRSPRAETWAIAILMATTRANSSSSSISA